MSFHFIKQILLFIEVIQEINNRSAKACSSSAIFTLEQCEVCAKLKVKTVELHHRHRSCIFIKLSKVADGRHITLLDNEFFPWVVLKNI